MAIDLETVPGLLCGQTYRAPGAEARLTAFREGEDSPYVGCGKSMAWVHAYRCRQCGRWMHGDCLDRHFGQRDAPR